MTDSIEKPGFELGSIMITFSAHEKLLAEDIKTALERHHLGDWGDCNSFDAEENDRAVVMGESILSFYHDRNGTRFLVTTGYDRRETVISLALPDYWSGKRIQ
jgi:hypothetical protein